MPNYPDAVDASKVGDYPALAGAGGGYVWDEALEYRVWCHPKDGSDDYFYAYSSYVLQRTAPSVRLADSTAAAQRLREPSSLPNLRSLSV